MSEAHNPALYRDLSEPFADASKCNEAIQAFFAAVAEARKKHHIRDALVVVSGSVLYPDTGEGEYHTLGQWGDMRNGPTLAAFALGETQADVRERINLLAAGKGRKAGR